MVERSIYEEMHDWLLRRVSVEEAEAEHTVDGMPFGAVHADWQMLRSMVLADPELQLWFFSSPEETWTTAFPLCGWEGYAVVKEGKIVDFLLTAIS